MQNNIEEINYLKLQNKLLKERLDNSKKSNDIKIKEMNKLRNEVKKSNIIDDLKKSHEAPSTVPELLQDIRKRDDKARTFAPPDNDEMEKLA